MEGALVECFREVKQGREERRRGRGFVGVKCRRPWARQIRVLCDPRSVSQVEDVGVGGGVHKQVDFGKCRLLVLRCSCWGRRGQWDRMLEVGFCRASSQQVLLDVLATRCMWEWGEGGKRIKMIDDPKSPQGIRRRRHTTELEVVYNAILGMGRKKGRACR